MAGEKAWDASLTTMNADHTSYEAKDLGDRGSIADVVKRQKVSTLRCKRRRVSLYRRKAEEPWRGGGGGGESRAPARTWRSRRTMS